MYPFPETLDDQVPETLAAAALEVVSIINKIKTGSTRRLAMTSRVAMRLKLDPIPIRFNMLHCQDI
jgi:hypothetical protein